MNGLGANGEEKPSSDLPTVASEGAELAQFRFYGRDFDAKAVRREGKLTVLAGSTVSQEESVTTPLGTRLERAQLLADGTVIQTDSGDLVFSRNREFNSASLAAGIVAGGSRSGPREWKHASGLSLKEWLDQGQA